MDHFPNSDFAAACGMTATEGEMQRGAYAGEFAPAEPADPHLAARPDPEPLR